LAALGTLKIDDKLRIAAPRLADARLRDGRFVAFDRRLPAPVHAVFIPVPDARIEAVFGAPKANDIVVELLLGRKLDEIDRAFAPIPDGLDPQGRPALVLGFEILIVGEIPRLLHEAEAFGVLVLKDRELQALRIDEGAPNPFAIAV